MEQLVVRVYDADADLNSEPTSKFALPLALLNSLVGLLPAQLTSLLEKEGLDVQEILQSLQSGAVPEITIQQDEKLVILRIERIALDNSVH